MTRGELDTPALLLDLDRFEANVRRLSTAIAAGGKDWRPHSKGHKSPWIARRQMELGAIGVTCAKVSEAEVMVDGGIPSVLIANELAAIAFREPYETPRDRIEVPLKSVPIELYLGEYRKVGQPDETEAEIDCFRSPETRERFQAFVDRKR